MILISCGRILAFSQSKYGETPFFLLICSEYLFLTRVCLNCFVKVNAEGRLPASFKSIYSVL